MFIRKFNIRSISIMFSECLREVEEPRHSFSAKVAVEVDFQRISEREF